MLEEIVGVKYKELFGSSPDLIVRAPGRINLLGEHTDYNGGYVLPAAIDKAIYLAIGKRSDSALHFYAIDLNEDFFGGVHALKKAEKHWANYLQGVISEALKDALDIGGVNVVFSGDIPLGAGLSSSAALESGMMAGLNQIFDLKLDNQQIILLAQRGENHFVGMNCGIMDMFASVMGRANQVIRLDCRDLNYAYFPFEYSDYKLVLLDSGVKHALVNSEYNTRRLECEQGVRFFQAIFPEVRSLRDVSLDMVYSAKTALPLKVFLRIKYVVEEIARVEAACKALESNDLHHFGLLMYATHEGLHHEYEVTCAETDFLVEMALAHQLVLGARQMGGGFGGCTLNLVHSSEAVRFVETAKSKYQQKFGHALKNYDVNLMDGVLVTRADYTSN